MFVDGVACSAIFVVYNDNMAIVWINIYWHKFAGQLTLPTKMALSKNISSHLYMMGIYLSLPLFLTKSPLNNAMLNRVVHQHTIIAISRHSIIVNS